MVAKVPTDIEARIVAFTKIPTLIASIGGGGGPLSPTFMGYYLEKRSKYSNRTVRNGYSNRAVTASREAV